MSGRRTSPAPSALPPQRNGRLSTSFRHAFAGMRYALRTQRNLRIHLGISAGVIALGLWLRLPNTQWAILALTIGLVLSAEMGNTALEATVDLVTDRFHPLAKVAKDAAAGAVLCAALLAVVVGLLIFAPPLLGKLGVWQP